MRMYLKNLIFDRITLPLIFLKMKLITKYTQEE